MPEIDPKRKEIGGSSIASVLGLSRWCTPLKTWAIMTGNIEPDDLSENEAVELGSELEDFVAKKFERKTGMKVRRDTRTFRHKKYDYLVAHIDRRIQGTDELLECKTCSAWKSKEWEDEEIPTEYILQCIWYLGILGMRKCYIAVLIGGQKFRWKEVDFDKELFDTMVEKAVEFWQMVQDKTPPAAVYGDKEVLSKIYPGNPEYEVIELDAEGDAEIIPLLGEINAMKDEIKHCEKKQEEAENKVKEFMGDAEILVTGDGDKITWKSQTRKSVDTKRLKDEGIYDKYVKEIESRVFRVSKKKPAKDK